MKKEVIIKAIKKNKCQIILDMGNESVNFVYQDEKGSEQNEKYNIVFPDIETIKQAIQYAVDYCIENNKINHYLKEIGVLKGIIKYYTNIPDDYFADDEIDIIINKGIVSYTDSNIDSNSNVALRRYYEAVITEIENVTVQNNNNLFGGFSVENEETKDLLFNVLESAFGNSFDNSLSSLT